MIKKHLDVILIVLGCIIILTAVSMKMYTHYEQQSLIEDYRKYIVDMKSQDELFNHQSTENEPLSQNVAKDKPKSSEKQLEKNIIGILSIPKIDLTVAIGEGVDHNTLKYSVGHFTETALPGQKGNCCIIGHRSYMYGEFFNRLDEIVMDDIITIESDERTYKYKVTQITVVKPEELSVLNQTENEEITLITCTPIRVGSHRLVIHGILVNE